MKKIILKGILLSTMLGTLTGCGKKEEMTGNNETNSGTESLKMWVGLNQAETYRKLAKEFEERNNIKVEVIEVEEADDALLRDPEAAADVIRVPHDQLGQLVAAGTVYENEKYADDIKSESIPIAIDAATYKGIMYGYPASADAMFLYYDKSVYTEKDLATLESLTAKGKVGLNIAEAGADYRLTPWFIANGALLYGEDGEDVDGSTLNNKGGLDVLNWVANAKNNPNIVAVNADEISALQERKISALFSGVWNAPNIKEVLGDNMGTAIYPTADFGEGEVSLKAFSGVPVFVVNSASKNPGAAMDLARYVTTQEAQLVTFKGISTVPCNKIARGEQTVQADPIVKTVLEMTTDDHSVLMPKIPEMKNFWPNMNALLVDAYQGKIGESQMQEKLDKLVENISKAEE